MITKWLQADIGGELLTCRGVLEGFEGLPRQETLISQKVT